MKLVKGNELSNELKQQVLAAYVHRNTVEHPYPIAGGKQLTDNEWLANNLFYITKAGKLSLKHSHCEPEWLADKKGK